jgi:hypothetical protein
MGVLGRGKSQIHMTGGEPTIMEDEWEPGGSMSLWDVIPRLLKAKNQRRVEVLQPLQVGGIPPTDPPTYYMNEKFFRESLSTLVLARANEHERGLKTVTDIEHCRRALALQTQELGMPEPESSRRWRDELDEMGAVIRHHRDHSPGPWMQGYVYPESTGVPTGY